MYDNRLYVQTSINYKNRKRNRTIRSYQDSNR